MAPPKKVKKPTAQDPESEDNQESTEQGLVLHPKPNATQDPEHLQDLQSDKNVKGKEPEGTPEANNKHNESEAPNKELEVALKQIQTLKRQKEKLAIQLKAKRQEIDKLEKLEQAKKR
jgi:hypothetical protein